MRLLFLLLFLLPTISYAAPVYRGDYPMNGQAWNHDWLPCKKDPKKLCWRVVDVKDMSTFGGAGAGGGAGGAGGGDGAGAW